ncbi:MAG: TlpA family protein disulfide reductase, partial [Candidatus Delongbacteria bacterium]|nr:TlpA family protein disulfide reductase [Candidatus Delongbacteria bacterium]
MRVKLLALICLAILPQLLLHCTIDEDPWPGSVEIIASSDLDGSDPGATIILDGVETLYHTPYTITDLAAGTHTIALSAADYSMLEVSYQIQLDNADPHTRLEILLIRHRGTVSVTAVDNDDNPLQARIVMDLTSQGFQTPYQLDPITGQHLLHLAANGYTTTPESLLVDVIHNEETTAVFILTQTPGDAFPVEVNAENEDGTPATGLEVWLDSRPYGLITPAQFEVIPADVDHLLELRVGYSIRAELLVPAGQQELLIWEPVITEIELSLFSVPPGMPIYLDEMVTGFITPHSFPLIGTHFVSVGSTGHATDLPGGWLLDIAESTDIEVTLTAGNNGVQLNDIATDFSLPLYGAPGVEMTLHQFRGRVVLLNFWFVDCPNCILEMPGLNTVYHEFRSQGFRFLAVDELGSSAAEAEAI